MVVISDSTTLSGLAKIDKLNLLREIFSKVYIPNEVYKELVEKGGYSDLVGYNLRYS